MYKIKNIKRNEKLALEDWPLLRGLGRVILHESRDSSLWIWGSRLPLNVD